MQFCCLLFCAQLVHAVPNLLVPWWCRVQLPTCNPCKYKCTAQVKALVPLNRLNIMAFFGHNHWRIMCIYFTQRTAVHKLHQQHTAVGQLPRVSCSCSCSCQAAAKLAQPGPGRQSQSSSWVRSIHSPPAPEGAEGGGATYLCRRRLCCCWLAGVDAAAAGAAAG